MILRRKKSGFTFVEILVVIAILAILFIVLISTVGFSIDKSRSAGIQSDFRSFEMAFSQVSKEHQGIYSFGYDVGDTNNNRKQDPGETWTGVYTFLNASDPTDVSSLTALENAVNKHLTPELYITINENLTISMKNDASDPWKSTYHGYIISNSGIDQMDKGVIVMYSNGADGVFGSVHCVQGGEVQIAQTTQNTFGADDYGIAICYSYRNGKGEVVSSLSGFTGNAKNESDELPEGETHHILNGKIVEVKTVEDVILRSDADYDDFVGLTIDGQEVPSNMYTVSSGSTVVRIKREFILSLKNGTHSVNIVSTDGIASCNVVLNISHTMVNVGSRNVHSQCSTCGYTVSEHTFTKTNSSGMCLECSCGYNSTAHSFRDVGIVRPATCTQPGISQYKCVYCGYSKTITSADKDPSNHTGEKVHGGSEDACMKYSCCGEIVQSSHSMTEKNTSARYIAKNATCTSRAEYYMSCECGYTDESATFVYGSTNSRRHTGTSTFAGKASVHTQYSCCGQVISTTHKYTESIVEDGCLVVRVYSECECGYQKDRKIISDNHLYCSNCAECTVCGICNCDEHEHDYSILVGKVDGTCSHKGYEIRKCSCGDTKTTYGFYGPHQYIPATCTDPEICELCDEENGSPLGHDYCDNCGECRNCEDCYCDDYGHDCYDESCSYCGRCLICEWCYCCPECERYPCICCTECGRYPCHCDEYDHDCYDESCPDCGRCLICEWCDCCHECGRYPCRCCDECGTYPCICDDGYSECGYENWN